MSVTKKQSKVIDEKEVFVISLENKKGLKVDFTNYGATMMSIITKDKFGNDIDVCLGWDNPEGYINSKAEFGAIVGRFANRIAKGQFTIEDKTYNLYINNGENHLHGGKVRYNKLVWDVVEIGECEEPYIVFGLTDEDMRENYPGTVEVQVKYTLLNDNSVKIEYDASTDKPTFVNLTNHCYFNLNGEGNGDVLNQYLKINTEYYTPVNEKLIPTGEILSVKGTELDFTKEKKIGDGIDSNFIQVVYGNGFDHNYAMGNSGKMKHAATAYCKESGVEMEVYTDKPGIQLYTGNFLNETGCKNGHNYGKRWAFCLETQFYPDSPNQPEFPESLLLPGEKYNFTTIYKFGIREEK